MFANTSGSNNSAFGTNALNTNTNGSGNSVFGGNSLKGANFHGSNNTIVGYLAGNSYVGTESSNILIGEGVSGVAGESNVTRIANISGTGIAGSPVLVSTTGQLGVAVSSQRYKDDIAQMGPTSVLESGTCYIHIQIRLFQSNSIWAHSRTSLTKSCPILCA